MRGARGRGLAAAAGVTVGLMTWGSTASAEVGAPAATVQAVAADAQFLEYAPPPAAPGVVCLIDSGVDLNPDTTPILAGSYALQPGTDTADELSKLNPPIEPGHHPDGHGTYMAMIMAAPVNGWGMAGIAPTSVRVYNLKALGAGHSSFSFGRYGDAVSRCIDGPIGVAGISVANLSLGSAAQPTASDLAGFVDTVAAARLQGVSVVAAAGNGGGSVTYPAAASGVLGVGATDANPAELGVFCPFSDSGPALSLLAPGCRSQVASDGDGNGVDVAFSDDGSPAWAFGTSDAAAVASAVLASMRAYGPKLGVQQAEGCVTSTAIRGGNLDAAAAFRACGLGRVVDQGFAALARITAQSPTVPPPPAPSPSSRPAPPPMSARPTRRSTVCPKVTVLRFALGVIDLSVAAIPGGALLRVDAERENRHGHFITVASTMVRGRRAKLRVDRWDRATVFFVTGRERSAVVHVSARTRQYDHAPISNCRASGEV